jgi:hypothetical protein
MFNYNFHPCMFTNFWFLSLYVFLLQIHPWMCKSCWF